MFTAINSNKVSDYMNSISDLRKKGSKSFLLFGESPVIQELNSALKEIKDIKVSVCPKGSKIEESNSTPFDAIVFDAHEDLSKVMSELVRLERKTEIIYHRRKADIILGYAIPKGGTNLTIKLIQNFGYDTVDARVNAEPNRITEDPASLKRNTCYIARNPLLGANGISLKAMLQWYSDEPVIAAFFNFRDPRDTLCSYIDYLLADPYEVTREVVKVGKINAKYGFGATPARLAHSAIVRSLPGLDSRIMHGITDSTFPSYNMFRESSWLLAHPNVCNVKFEDLVGKQGGGDEIAQRTQVGRLMCHLGLSGDPVTYAENIYGNSPTFKRGQLGSWKEKFNEKHRIAFNARFADVLELYGYE
jgi:hypothetical protein